MWVIGGLVDKALALEHRPSSILTICGGFVSRAYQFSSVGGHFAPDDWVDYLSLCPPGRLKLVTDSPLTSLIYLFVYDSGHIRDPQVVSVAQCKLNVLCSVSSFFLSIMF
ncbi:hypothetical protein RRG08_037995 [Elysia crispata]|uniref:Uncharacterized protein n=1 Tax=Elysia crispata TaxID=231223 RepID=A0AAE1ACE1_9GAST|nr:hypothetical protein RRG08_037995 [Elysia crispata]